jgi:hypothetical protein
VSLERAMHKLLVVLSAGLLLAGCSSAGGVRAGGGQPGSTATKSPGPSGFGSIASPVSSPAAVTGSYLWQDPNGVDVVLLSLLETPGGISGTWSETALKASAAVALNGTETDKPPQNSFPLNGHEDGPASFSLTVASNPRPTFEAQRGGDGIDIVFAPLGGGIRTLHFAPSTTQSYSEAAQAIAESCSRGNVYCGQGH